MLSPTYLDRGSRSLLSWPWLEIEAPGFFSGYKSGQGSDDVTCKFVMSSKSKWSAVDVTEVTGSKPNLRMRWTIGSMRRRGRYREWAALLVSERIELLLGRHWPKPWPLAIDVYGTSRGAKPSAKADCGWARSVAGRAPRCPALHSPGSSCDELTRWDRQRLFNGAIVVLFKLTVTAHL